MLLFYILSSYSATSQSREIMRQFRQLEMQSWQEFILKSEIHRGDENIDVKFYQLNVEIAIDSAYIIGDVLCKFEPVTDDLTEVRLDLDRSLMVTGISLPCESFEQVDDEIIIQLNQPFNAGEEVELIISYQGVPVLAGGYKGLRYEQHNGNEPIIATLSTPFVAHYWYPCKDGPEDKADSVYIDITIENKLVNGIEMKAVSNGVLENTSISGNKKTFYWRHRYPIVTYYVMAAISNYVHFDEEYEFSSGETMPLDYYAFNEKLETQQQGVEDMPDVLDLFNDRYGPYPFANEKYGMTQLGYYGAIENQTNTITNSMASDWFMVSVHELAHMWFGDMITCETWNHAWLNEGFATYSEALWLEHDLGIQAYKSKMNALKYFQGGTIYLENPLDTFNVFTAIIYHKGAWALHMLRGVVRDSLFFESVNNYALDSNFMFKSATTEDLQEVFETTCNTDLDYYFEEWIYDAYYPIYHYNFIQESEKLFVSLYQAQEELYGRRPVFEMPVQIQVDFTDDTDTTITVWNDEQLQMFEFEFNKEVNIVFIDPNNWILRKVYFKNDLPVGIADIEATSAFRVYPNPVDDFLFIEVLNPVNYPLKLRLYNLSGKEAGTYLIKSNHSKMNTSSLNNGLYLYEIFDNRLKKFAAGKIIKE